MARILLAILVFLLLSLQYRLWFGEGSIVSVAKLNDQVQQQIALNKQLQQRNNVLIAEVKDLKSGHDAVEERARNDLGMIKKDETFYQIVK